MGVFPAAADMCAHQSLAFWEYTRGKGQSAAQVYVDIVCAFDAVVRQLVFGSDQLPFDTGIALIVSSLGLPPEVIHYLASELSKRSMLQDLHVPLALARPGAKPTHLVQHSGSPNSNRAPCR